MGSSSVFRCNCVDRFMCIVLCEREDVRVLVGVSFCFVGVFFLDSVCRVLFFWRCVMGSSSVFRCNCVDRFMCIVLCEREDVRVLRHACHHVLMSPLFCLGQKLVALRVLDVSLNLFSSITSYCPHSGNLILSAVKDMIE